MVRYLIKNWLAFAVIVVITGLAIWIVIPQHPKISVGSFMRDLNFKLGLDLQGGVHLVYKADVKGVGEDQVEDALAGVRDVIERRVNTFGISEPLVQTNRVGDEHRVIVELAGVHDPDQAIELIGQTPQLDFRREVSQEEALQQFNIDNPESITGPIFERTELTGRHLKRATVAFDPLAGTPQVNLEFDSEGTQLFAELTRQNLNKRVAIYLDGVPISAPVVQSEITNGQAVISGGFALPEAKQLAQNLNAGALPIPIELIGQQTVGPSLGRLSLQQSLRAGLLGLGLVVIFLVFVYRLLGIVASVTLALYIVFFLAIVKLLPVTLTLAGIAGIILSIGMAVDANVLIFERIKENIKAGHTMQFSLQNGFKDAWSSIVISNVSSLLTAFILYGFGTSIIRGFALTYSLGIILSMFTAVTITRLFINLLFSSSRLHKPWLLGVRL